MASEPKINNHYSPAKKKYNCNQCNYSCTTAGALTIHMRAHSGEKPYSCNQCTYACTTAVGLRTHMRTHSGVKPYDCKQCEYSCKTASSLKRHMRQHSGEKPFACNQALCLQEMRILMQTVWGIEEAHEKQTPDTRQMICL